MSNFLLPAQPAGAELSPDERFMAEAIMLSRAGLGLAAPNPSVGALVVQRGAVVGRGVTAAGGRPHGERLALDQAGERARGATLYVTLEPCARRSQRADATACTDLIIAAGIARVVIGADDPSPHAAQEGPKRLASAGVSVTRGVLAPAARRVNLGHVLRMTDDRPLVLLKLARTADGFVAEAGGAPLAITGKQAFAITHRLRAESDAILVGIGTVLADDPALTCRLPGLEDRSPIRVVLDSGLRLPSASRLATTAAAVPTWVIAAVDAPLEAERHLRRLGVEVMRVDRAPGGGLALQQALRLLAARGITRLMVEGGPRVAEALAAADLIDDLVLFTSPRALGHPGKPMAGRALAGWLGVIPVAQHLILPDGDRLDHHERTR
jgi:diaminohydroxyphosphoribosylaminopyrimidine deaminase/5-amino-6-(5-phosphoribosylamino)uracil reductase